MPELPDEEMIGGLVTGWLSGEAAQIVQPAPRRFFATTAMRGRLYPDGIPQGGPWDATALVYWTEPEVDMILNVNVRKVQAAAELREALRESQGRAASLRLWLLEGLEDAAMLERARTSGTR